MTADNPSPSTEASASVVAAQTQRSVILAIDDDSGLLDNIRRLLIREDWVVLTASDPVEGLQLYQEHWRVISLVLLDFYMHGLRGDQVWTLLHEINPEVQVLWMTASDDYIPSRMRNGGRSAFVQKPATRLDLLQGIREVLDHHEQ